MDDMKLYEALVTIKKYCSKSECCTCALSTGSSPYNCKVADNNYAEYPKNWKLRRPNYKAFEEEK